MSEIMGIGRIRFHEGRVDEFKRLWAECVEVVRSEDTGTLQYDLYFDDDESECVIIERYRDVAALLEHAGHVGEIMQQALATGSFSGQLLGEPSDELRAMTAGMDVGLFTPYTKL